MHSRRDCPPGIIAVLTRDAGVSRRGSLCRLTTLLRPLLIAIGCALVSTQAQGLPLALGCAPSLPAGSSAECQPVLFRMTLGPPVTENISQEALLRLIVDTDATRSTLLSSLGSSPSGFLANLPGQQGILFSLTTDTETGVVARLQNEPLRNGMDDMVLHGGSADALAEQFPFPRAAAFLLLSSGLALTTRRRRGSPMLDEQTVCALQEVSSARSRTRLYRSTQRMCHSQPLRI